jgi:hypothetical protein
MGLHVARRKQNRTTFVPGGNGIENQYVGTIICRFPNQHFEMPGIDPGRNGRLRFVAEAELS